MRRIISVLAVVALLAAMMAAMAMPAFAVPTSNFGHCHKSLNQGILVADSNREINDTFNPPKSRGQEGPTIGC
jgi:hypothetical protein